MNNNNAAAKTFSTTFLIAVLIAVAAFLGGVVLGFFVAISFSAPASQDGTALQVQNEMLEPVSGGEVFSSFDIVGKVTSISDNAIELQTAAGFFTFPISETVSIYTSATDPTAAPQAIDDLASIVDREVQVGLSQSSFNPGVVQVGVITVY